MVLEILKASISSEQPATGQRHSALTTSATPLPASLSQKCSHQLLNQPTPATLSFLSSIHTPTGNVITVGVWQRGPSSLLLDMAPPPPCPFLMGANPTGAGEGYIQARLLSQSQPGHPTHAGSGFCPEAGRLRLVKEKNWKDELFNT